MRKVQFKNILAKGYQDVSVCLSEKGVEKEGGVVLRKVIVVKFVKILPEGV